MAAISNLSDKITKNKDEFERLVNDMECYKEFAYSFKYKVLGAQQVLNYKWSKDVEYLKKAVPLLEKSNEYYKKLAERTKDTYLYANSMQTSQRRIPVGGDGGKFKTWEEMIPVYEDELNSLKSNIVKLTSPDDANSKNEKYPKAVNADVKLISNYKTVTLTKGAKLFENRDEAIDSLAPELEGLKLLCSTATQRASWEQG